MSVLRRHIEACQNVGPDITAQSISVELNCVFNKLKLQDFESIPVNAPSSTDTKDGCACESLQSLELHFTALDWIVLMRNMVKERNLRECESNCLGWRDAPQFGIQIYFMTPNYQNGNNTLKTTVYCQNCVLEIWIRTYIYRKLKGLATSNRAIRLSVWALWTKLLNSFFMN